MQHRLSLIGTLTTKEVTENETAILVFDSGIVCFPMFNSWGHVGNARAILFLHGR